MDKVLYPQTGTTKAEVARYYAQVAEVMLPHCVGRPATRKRWVEGVGTARRPKEAFFAKDLDAGTPSWVVRAAVQHSDHVNTYPVVSSVATLVWFAQIAALEVHVPQWRLNQDGEPGNPDRLVLDLDPGPGIDLPTVAGVAAMVRDILEPMGMATYPVTSGSKGVHLYAPLDGTVTSAQASELARELARSLEADHPDVVLSRMKRSAREGKVFLDWSQNNAKKTTIAPYSMRGTALPYVAAPRTWEEMADPELRQLTAEQVLELVDQRGDPMAPLGVAASAAPDRLALYRSKRSAGATPEPVPPPADPQDVEAVPPPAQVGGENSGIFVIQEHHASVLHWDFRLEHEGVLVSWALPKGVPASTDKNHLAVPTEDHPLEYAQFAGTIPQDQYGGGEVRIWDHGTFTAEKWRDGKEVIATLTGAPDGGLYTHGPGRVSRFALINTSGERNSWLIHLMKPRRTNAVKPPRRRPPPQPASTAGTEEVSTVRPMLATAGSAASVTAAAWAIEMKWDGVRAIVHVRDGAVRVFGRSGIETTEQYPELAELSDLVHADSAVLDGEIVALDPAGAPNFGLLQPRIQATGAAVAAAARAQPIHLMLFDVLTVNDQDVTGFGYDERRELLVELVTGSDRVAIPPVFDGNVDAALQASADHGLEGVVAKRRSSAYLAGSRSPAWVKIRHTLGTEVVVIGWRAGHGSRAGTFGSLLLAVPDGDGGWRYAGRVGSGFSDREVKRWSGELRADQIEDAPVADVPDADARDASWVRPTRVAEVSFSAWTAGGRLRHPVWRGWRTDKDPDDIEPVPR